MDWNYFKYIETISLTGNLSKAAKQLQIDTSTLSRALQKFENDFGTRIFRRVGNRYVVTASGKAWVAGARAVRSQVDALALSPEGGRAPVVVTSLEIFLNHYLLPRVSHFKSRLEFIGADKSLDLSRREADVAIRFGKPRAGEYVVQKLFTAGHAVYAGRAFRESLPEMKTCEWATLNDDFESIDDSRWLRENIGESQTRYKMSSCEQIRSVLKSVPVLGILPCYMADADPRLVRFTPHAIAFERSGWLVVHRELIKQKALREFIDALKKQVAQDARLLRGV